MSLIQAREILWDEIIEIIRNICEFLVIMSNEKALVIDMEGEVMKDKQKDLDISKFAKMMIDFINSKCASKLKEHDFPDRTLCAIDFNKMIVRNIYRNSIEKKLKEMKEVVVELRNGYVFTLNFTTFFLFSYLFHILIR